jgi:hypothetical protein
MKIIKKFFFFYILFSLFFTLIAYAGSEKSSEKRSEKEVTKREDVIFIDTLKNFEDIQRPPAVFLHDLHTDALQKKNKDCKTCHLFDKDKNRILYKFKRVEDTDKTTLIDNYHKNCIDCHTNKKFERQNEKTGPITCNECHVKEPSVISSRQPLFMDKSLHFRHIKAFDEKCETCHHEYDKEKKKLFYAKGEEKNCRYCHEKEKIDNRISMKEAAHIACIDCHIKNIDKQKKSGFINCSGCHNKENIDKIEKIKNVPRLKRNQPDVALIKLSEKDMTDEKKSKFRMSFVPFNHKLHENVNDTCLVCHHKDLNSCNKCHTQEGSEDGGGISLEQSMHSVNNNTSCIGCHEIKKHEKECAGCHNTNLKDNDEFCNKCHIKTSKEKKDSQDDKAFAKFLLESRLPVQKYDIEKIPEKVKISTLQNKYEPVDFPHRKVVTTMINSASENGLAKYFHKDSTVCQGCHHNSPASDNPSLCESCHRKEKSFKNKVSLRPELMGAYHIQCMGCHKRMNIDKPTGCTECHKEKNK